jgi:hypothetical protein
MTNCLKCEQPLRIFSKRLDFDGRKYHFKCWKELVQEKLHRRVLLDYLEFAAKERSYAKLIFE